MFVDNDKINFIYPIGQFEHEKVLKLQNLKLKIKFITRCSIKRDVSR